MQLERHGGKWKKEKKMTKSRSDEEQYGESTNPFHEIHEGMAKEELRRKMKKADLNVVDSMYNVVWDEDTKKKNEIKKTAKKLAELKNKKTGRVKQTRVPPKSPLNKKGGGMIKYSDGGAVGNTASNFKGCF